MFVYSRHKYHVPNVRHNIIYDCLSLCLRIRDICKYCVDNVWHIIYDHRSSYFYLTEIKSVSLMFDRWSMIIVLYFVFYRYEYRVLNVRQVIYDQHSSYVCIPDFVPCPYCLHIIHDLPSICLCLSEFNSILLYDISICERRCFCLCNPEINTVPLTFDISSIIIVVYILVLQR